MTVRITAFLADSAEALNGKLYVLGAGWDTIGATSFPAVHSRVAIGVIVHVGWNDTDIEHEVAVRLETEDGQPVPLGRNGAGDGSSVIGMIGHRFTATRGPLQRPGDDLAHPITFTINDLRLARAGGYSWVLTVDREIVHRLPMRVVQATQG
ncbi:hypothetical protein CLV46_2730 [Diaminobutyricimonas aerilata]|uniref:Uncharacterized protein n=1 Tax=Diaminobutyricimonas aerilata TaxID=1162967 RepID=A0A2M9CMN9_9MICO|nr:hypothetical protein [Diaminobutyricimonas aerilata]PJJ73145.1 hypothetical protein CLV46_2730 [Diaminobutyricimonas aerilata]